MTSKGTFSTLNPQSKIFTELRKQQPDWWILFTNDKELYIEIRKDNYINVYYFGGAIAKIKYKNGFLAEIHQKYLGDTTPSGITKKGLDKFGYNQLDLAILDQNVIAEIKHRIKSPLEKQHQGKLIKENSKYIDSEFQFNQDTTIDNLRIDLVELSEDLLSFVELKLISDSRLRINPDRIGCEPEIVSQMAKYTKFIEKYESGLKNHYENLLAIKRELGLSKIASTNLTINKIPKLLIINTYTKQSQAREERIADIKSILLKNKINFSIEDENNHP